MATDPWKLLWERPYLHVLQFLHVHLRANDAWTVPVEPPAPPVAEATFAHLLAPDTAEEENGGESVQL